MRLEHFIHILKHNSYKTEFVTLILICLRGLSHYTGNLSLCLLRLGIIKRKTFRIQNRNTKIAELVFSFRLGSNGASLFWWRNKLFQRKPPRRGGIISASFENFCELTWQYTFLHLRRQIDKFLRDLRHYKKAVFIAVEF